VTYLGVYLQRLSKLQKILVRTAGLWAQIVTRDILHNNRRTTRTTVTFRPKHCVWEDGEVVPLAGEFSTEV